ncbi:MAG: hypothetical protein AB7S80_07105 [Rhizobiaceae bacterium]
MSGILIGAAVGLGIGVVTYAALKVLAGRVDLDDTKRVLNVTGLIDLVLFPVVGAVAGWLIAGD